MNDEQLKAATTFITMLLGEPYEDWWMSENNTTSRVGKPVTGWYVTTHDDILTLSWEDWTPNDVLIKLYAIIGWALMNGVIVYTPQYVAIPASKDRAGVIHHIDQREGA